MFDADRRLFFPEYSSFASFVTVFETHTENGEVPLISHAGPAGEKAIVQQGVSYGVPQGSGESEIAGYEENDEEYPHDNKPYRNSSLRPFLAGDLKFACRDDIGNISRDEHSS